MFISTAVPISSKGLQIMNHSVHYVASAKVLISFDCWLCACVLNCVSYLCAIDGVSVVVGWQVSVCRMTSVQLAKACPVAVHKWSVDCIRSSSVVECLSYTDVPLVPAWLRLSLFSDQTVVVTCSALVGWTSHLPCQTHPGSTYTLNHKKAWHFIFDYNFD